MRSRLDPRLQQRLVWAGALCLLGLQVALFHSVRADDAYITYRYGQNLASGLGLVFNAGQRVQGSTSPGHMLLSALIYALFGPARTPGVMAAIGCMAWNAQALALYLLLEKALGFASAGLIALTLALGVTGAAAWVPLETNLVAAFVLFSFVLAREQRWLLAAASCGAAVLMRPDACLAAAVLLAVGCRQLRVRVLAPVAVFLGIVLPWLVFASFYYGSPVPQTAITKFQRVGLLEYFIHELSYPGVRLLWLGPGIPLTLLALALAAVGAVRLVRYRQGLSPFLAYGALHAAAYLVLRPFTAHSWHLYPWTLVFCVCALAAVAPRAQAGAHPAVYWVQAAALVLLLSMTGVRFAAESKTLARGYWTGQRDAVYQRIAADLRARAKPGEWFASVEVGTLAYFSALPAYDLGGLVTRLDADPMSDHPVRFIVLDKAYLAMAPSAAPVFSASEGDFSAYVYEMRLRE
jgi:hypothetical protein